MASRIVFVVVFVLTCCLCECRLYRHKYTQVDVLFRTRCRLACGAALRNKKCEKDCLMSTKDKPGFCSEVTFRPFDGACISACSKDTQCLGIEKCCSHSCGATYQIPTGLESVEGLTSIPENITVKERGKKRSAAVTWHVKSLGTSPVIYIVEERHHLGRHWDPAYLGSWTVRNKTNKTKCYMKNLLPGYWYQVRVASVNVNGSRGYSNPSMPFSLDSWPNKPKKPHNLDISKLGWLNGTMYGVLSWEAPESDLPIQKYKVFWSSIENSTETKIQQATLPSKETNYILKKLKPQSIHYIQVQALSHFGKQKLKSEKASIDLNLKKDLEANYNWTNYFSNQHKDYKKVRNHGLRHTRFFWQNEKLHCHIEWKGSSSPPSYMLTWSPHSCSNSLKQDTLEATTQTTSFDIYGLTFDCKYKIVLQETSRNIRKIGTIYITTPPCKKYSGSPGNHLC